jgi:hypothetical protein
MHTIVGSVQDYPKGRIPSTAVYVGMPGGAACAYDIPDEAVLDFGKPWACLKDPRGWEPAYREYLWNRIQNDADFALAVRDLHGKTLLCWCKAKAARNGHNEGWRCHALSLASAAEWLYHGIRKELA